MSRTRRTQFGYRRRRPTSDQTHVGFKPLGWSDQPDVDAPVGSMQSGQNMWLEQGRMRPRSRLSTIGDTNIATPIFAPVQGSFLHDDIDGVQYAMAVSSVTVSFLELTGSWVSLNYASGASDYPLTSAGDLNYVNGDSVYLPRRDLNITVFTNAQEPLFAWGGPSDGTAYSTLTQAPIAADVVTFDNSPIAWNTFEFSQSKRFVTRVQWPQVQDPENWLGIGSGFEDLVDMRGAGTRIFKLGDEMILATTQEIARGRRVGGAFRFAFTPLTQEMGMPFPRATIQTKLGIFWLNDDYMVYLLQPGGKISPVGQFLLQDLRDTLVDFGRAFFSQDEARQQVTLHYTTALNEWPQRAFTLHAAEQQWAPQRYAHNLTSAVRLDITNSAITWGDDDGSGWVGGGSATVASQTSTWLQLEGRDGSVDPLLFSSGGTAYTFSSVASRDGDGTANDASVVEAQYVSTGLFTGDPIHHKWVDRVRIDARADSASSLSVGVSGNLGGAYVEGAEQAFSVNSQTSQLYVPLTQGGEYFSLRLSSEETGWEVSRVFVRGRILGDSLG